MGNTERVMLLYVEHPLKNLWYVVLHLLVSVQMIIAKHGIAKSWKLDTVPNCEAHNGHGENLYTEVNI